MKDRILLVEDDEALAMGIQYALQAENMVVTSVCDFATVKEAYHGQQGTFDLILMDVMLPDASGYEICQWIRERDQEIPVIFLTALEDEGNIVHGLDVGGDDYVVKPFRTKELAARIRANIRRKGFVSKKSLRAGELMLDEDRLCVWRADEKILLTFSEFKLLRELLMHQGQILTREHLMETLWSVDEAFVDDNTLSVYIRRLREKIDQKQGDSHIKTVRGVGYVWQDHVDTGHRD